MTLTVSTPDNSSAVVAVPAGAGTYDLLCDSCLDRLPAADGDETAARAAADHLSARHAPADPLEATRQQIRRLARALAARDRCAAMATRAAVRATLSKTEQVRLDWQELALGYRVTREQWNEQIRDLRRALRD